MTEIDLSGEWRFLGGYPAAKPTTTRQKFDRFNAQNGHVYRILESLAQRAVDHGRTRIGIAQIYEVARWEMAFTTTGDGLKLNNDWRSYYARLLQENHPEWPSGLFETRESPKKESING